MRYLAFDIGCTVNKHSRSDIFSFGYAVMDDQGNITEKKALNVTTSSGDHAGDIKRFADVYNEIFGILTNAENTVLAHSALDDLVFLFLKCERNRLKFPDVTVYDTKKMFMKRYRENSDILSMAKKFGMEFRITDALENAIASLTMVQKMASEDNTKTEDVIIDPDAKVTSEDAKLEVNRNRDFDDRSLPGYIEKPIPRFKKLNDILIMKLNEIEENDVPEAKEDYELGKRYEFVDVFQDLELAAFRYMSAAQLGLFDAKKIFASPAANDNVSKDRLTIIGIAAESENVAAQASLGKRYLRGLGVEKHRKGAIYWLSQAAENGHAASQFLLAKAYSDRNHPDADDTLSFLWMERSALNGNQNAQFELGLMHERGRLTPKNKELAFKWMKESSDNGNTFAMEHLAELYLTGQGTEKNAETAVELYKKSHQKGSKDASLRLGRLYEEGLEIPVNMEEAIKWYRSAAKHKFDAKFALYSIYKEGPLADEKAAERYYKEMMKDDPVQLKKRTGDRS